MSNICLLLTKMMGGRKGPSTFTLSGTITGDEVEGVTITLTGDASDSTTSAADGTYSFTGLSNGDYNVEPSLEGYIFDPTDIDVTIASADDDDNNFASTAVYTISGTITGDEVEGVTVALTGDATDSTTSAADGTYSFTGVVDGSYTVTPTLDGYTFTPENASVTISGADDTGNDFSAFGYFINWEDGVVPGADVTVISQSGGSPTSSSAVTPQSANGAYTPSESPCIRIQQPQDGGGSNNSRVIFSPPSGIVNYSSGIKIEAIVYEATASNDIRLWVQLIDYDDPNTPYIGFYIISGTEPDGLRVIERRSTTSSTILESNTGGDIADAARFWWRLRLQLPANLSGNVVCSASPLGTGGYTGTERSIALTQNWSTFTTGKVHLLRNNNVDDNIDWYIARVWIGTASDDWPA